MSEALVQCSPRSLQGTQSASATPCSSHQSLPQLAAVAEGAASHIPSSPAEAVLLAEAAVLSGPARSAAPLQAVNRQRVAERVRKEPWCTH